MSAELDTCGACAGISPQTPAVVENRAGLSAISYRVGTQPLFAASMQARLGSLQGLRTRDSGDFTIGLLDAWACVADVLTFYQERIANESYLRTATERRSLTSLSELVGYTPQPGVAASTWLAFTMTATPGAPDQAAAPVDIAIGTRVQSMPAPGGLPQTFETIEAVPARVEWNAFRPSLSKPQTVAADAQSILFSGVATGLKPGDNIVIVPTDAGSRPVLRTVAGVTPMAAQQQTWVSLLAPASVTATPAPAAPLRRHGDRIFESLEIQRIQIAPLGIAEPRVLPTNWSSFTQRATIGRLPFVAAAADLEIFGLRARMPVKQLLASLAAWSAPVTPSVYALRTKASLFGYNAPDPRSLVDSVAANYAGDRVQATATTLGDWFPFGTRIQPVLDASYPRIAAGTADSPSFAVLKWGNAQGEHWMIANVASAADAGYAKYTLSGKVAHLSLTPLAQSDSSATAELFASFDEYRGTSLQAESEALALARLPRTDEPLPADSVIDLDTWVDGLYVGQRLIVSGELDQSRGTYASEMVRIQAVDHVIAAGGYTSLTLASALTNAYVRETVTINGNVAAATHGSAVQEVLGSGNATTPSQRFVLRQSPLTYVSAATASGVSSTLALRVNGMLWAEVPDFFGRAPGERIYTTRLNDDGMTTVSFGDGINGARPASGSENIVAGYRKGIGAIGNVGAGQLSLLQTRPLGVQSVNNPVAASGGTDADSPDDIRSNAALALRTLGRIVSLRDYEDFARAFGGIAKSLATWTWHGQTRGVFVTVAGIAGADVTPTATATLLSAIADAAEPNVPVRISSYRRAAFTFSASLMVDPAYDMNAVLAAARQAATNAYSFERRSFGQAVTRSEIIALLQDVTGVVAVQVSSLLRTDNALFTTPRLTSQMILAAQPDLSPRSALASRLGVSARPIVLRENSQINAALPQIAADDTVLAAELLTLDPRPLNLVATWAEAPP